MATETKSGVIALPEDGAEILEDFDQSVSNPAQSGYFDRTTRARNRTLIMESKSTQLLREKLRQRFNDDSWENAWDRTKRNTVVEVPTTNIKAEAYQATVTNDASPTKKSTPTSQISSNQTISQDLPPLVGFLVSFDLVRGGEVFELRPGRWIITSNRPGNSDSCLVISDPSISEFHATMRITTTGAVEIADQFSLAGTFIQSLNSSHEQAISSSAVELKHGDTLRLGQRRFSVCLLVARRATLPSPLNLDGPSTMSVC